MAWLLLAVASAHGWVILGDPALPNGVWDLAKSRGADPASELMARAARSCNVDVAGVTAIELDADTQIEAEKVRDVAPRGAAEDTRSQATPAAFASQLPEGPTEFGLALCHPALDDWYMHVVFEEPRRRRGAEEAARQRPGATIHIDYPDIVGPVASASAAVVRVAEELARASEAGWSAVADAIARLERAVTETVRDVAARAEAAAESFLQLLGGLVLVCGVAWALYTLGRLRGPRGGPGGGPAGKPGASATAAEGAVVGGAANEGPAFVAAVDAGARGAPVVAAVPADAQAPAGVATPAAVVHAVADDAPPLAAFPAPKHPPARRHSVA